MTTTKTPEKKMTIIEQRHRSLPQTITAEQLGKWITEHQKKVIDHSTKTPLTPKEVSELEHKSAAASGAIYALAEVETRFKDFIKNGTPFDGTQHQPQDVTIPPTKGKKELEANRLHANSVLKKGYNEDITEIYIIPFPEESTMVAVDIVGNEWVDYTKQMTEQEEGLYGKLFVKEKDGKMRQLELSEVDVNKHSGTAEIKTKKSKVEPFI